MVRINKIIAINSFQITGQFNDGQIKRLGVYPRIKNHLHLNGVSSLLDETIFKNAKLGDFGEIYWPQIVVSKDATIMDYDISPEFFYNNGVVV